MNTLQKIDEKYIDSLKSVTNNLANIYKDISDTYQFDLSKTEISEAVIIRLKTYYETNSEIKKLLDKVYLASAADFFC
jgi:hypothetical protein